MSITTSTRWASGSIAGVALVDGGGRDCRIDVGGAEALRSRYTGKASVDLNFGLHLQLADVARRDVRLQVKIAQLLIAKRDSIITAIEAAVAAGNTFNVTLGDANGVDAINDFCLPDYEAAGGRLFTRGGFSGGYIKDCVFNFVTTGS
jgi:hypothetical protein